MGISPAAASMPAASSGGQRQSARDHLLSAFSKSASALWRAAQYSSLLQVDDDSVDDLVGPRRRDLVGRRALGQQ
jgi:hypothetical protein